MSESTPASESAAGENIVQTEAPDLATHLQIDVRTRSCLSWLLFSSIVFVEFVPFISEI